MKRKKSGFTTVELLTVLGIIAVLVGLLIPAVTMVRRGAKETAQKAQLTTIDLALIAFKNDDGDYPSSYVHTGASPGDYYCGAQKLAEALLGWDLLGFHPASDFRALGHVNDEGVYNSDNETNLRERRGPYLDLATANVFRLGNNPARQDPHGLFNDPAPLAADTFVICDSFGAKKISIGGKAVMAGTPILYYRANTSSRTIDPAIALDARIYNALDNLALIDLRKMTDTSRSHPLVDPVFFYGDPTAVPPVIGYIQDPKVTARPWPYRPDSYILISAGADGLYGTSDDICNFGN